MKNSTPLSSERAAEMCSEMYDLLQWWCSFTDGSGKVVGLNPSGTDSFNQDIQPL